MSELDYQNPKQPADIMQRRPLDALWFTILFASIAIGIGMTLFAPIGNDPPGAPASPATPATAPTTTAPTSTATSPAL